MLSQRIPQCDENTIGVKNTHPLNPYPNSVAILFFSFHPRLKHKIVGDFG